MNAIKDLISNMQAGVTTTGDKEQLQKELQEFQVETYNNENGNLDKEDGISCTKCKNKGFKQIIKNGYVMMRKCECMERRSVINKAKRSGLGEYLNKTINDYEVWQPQNEKYKLMLIDYLKKHSNNNTWFVALGQSGSGKTLLCSIIANYLLYSAGRNVLYVTWTDFISRLKRDIMGDNSNTVSKYLDEVKKVEVLFLDEVIKKYNETDLKYLIEIINYRYTNNLKTIITSERDLNDLLDVDEATFGRAVEKCEGYLIEIPKDRRFNYRLKALIRN